MRDGRYTLEEIEAMPTIRQSQTDDLKVETFNTRTWVSRLTVEDGFPYDNQVTEEALVGGNWITVDEYEARSAREDDDGGN